MQLVVTIFNSAGEVVRHFFTGTSQNLLTGFAISSSSLAQGGGGVTLSFGGEIQGGGNSLVWLGTNDNGQPVSGGTYTIMVQTTDPYGSVQSWTKSVTVIPQALSQSLDIYNSAGELVATLNPSSFSSLPIVNIGFGNSSRSAFVLGSGSGVKFMMQNSSGGQVTTTWDGKSNSGQVVSPGSYIVQLVDNDNGRIVVQSKSFVVLGDLSSSSFRLIMGPNPVGPTDHELVFSFSGIQAGQTAHVKLYNVAGELIGQAAGSVGGNRVVVRVGNWSSGLYVVVAESHDGPMVVSRQLQNFAVQR